MSVLASRIIVPARVFIRIAPSDVRLVPNHARTRHPSRHDLRHMTVERRELWVTLNMGEYRF
jgi:hypothetical protein